MTRVRCPKDACLFWKDGWCQSDEIELSPLTLACLNYEEYEEIEDGILGDALDDELDWDVDEALNDDELDESLYDNDPVEMELFDDDLDDEPDLEDEFELYDPSEEDW
jgi:hypothetical protein